MGLQKLIKYKMVVVFPFLLAACSSVPIPPQKFYSQPPPEKAAKINISYRGVNAFRGVVTFEDVDTCAGYPDVFKELASEGYLNPSYKNKEYKSEGDIHVFGGKDLVLSTIYQPTFQVDEDIYNAGFLSAPYACHSFIKFRPEPGMNYQLIIGSGPIIPSEEQLVRYRKDIKHYKSLGKRILFIEKPRNLPICHAFDLTRESANGQRSPVSFEIKGPDLGWGRPHGCSSESLKQN